MSMSSLSAASALDATQSPLLSLGQTKRRKHPSMSNAQTQNGGAPTHPSSAASPAAKSTSLHDATGVSRAPGAAD